MYVWEYLTEVHLLRCHFLCGYRFVKYQNMVYLLLGKYIWAHRPFITFCLYIYMSMHFNFCAGTYGSLHEFAFKLYIAMILTVYIHFDMSEWGGKKNMSVLQQGSHQSHEMYILSLFSTKFIRSVKNIYTRMTYSCLLLHFNLMYLGFFCRFCNNSTFIFLTAIQ